MTSPLPNAPVGQITGILEIVHGYKGKAPLSRIAADYDLDLAELLPSVEACELLGFLTVVDGQAALTETGTKMLKASLRQRKLIFRDQALQTPFFQDVVSKLSKTGGRMKKKALAEIVGFKLWTHDSEQSVRTLINWGRHGGILSYDADSQEIVLL
jgi:NitT/TauT family transport system ATP-binding protein